MANRKGELPSGSIRRQVLIGYEPLFDAEGVPIIDPKTGRQKKKRIYQSVTATSAKEANQIAAQVRATKESIVKSDLLFCEAMERYINIKRNVLSPSTVRGYVQMKTYYKALDPLPITSIDNIVLQEWVNNFSKNHSPKTVKNAYGLAISVLDMNKIKVSASLPAKQPKNLYVPNDTDVKKIIQYFTDKGDSDMLIAICLAAFATLRRSEICALDASDVNRQKNIIHIHDGAVVNDKKELVKKGTPKTESSDRYIDIPAFIIEMLPTSGPLVTISPDNVTNRFCRALRKNNVPLFRFHDLRHYSASIMHAIGVPDVYIMDRGGWKSDETLKRIYRGAIDDYKVQFASQTNDYFTNLQHEMQHEEKE